MNSRALSLLANAVAATCCATGILYSVHSWPAYAELGPPRAFLLSASIIGAASLLIAGRWQQIVAASQRALPLLSLTTLAGLYVLANVIGVTLGLSWWLTVAFVFGLILGAVLFALAAWTLLEDQRARPASDGPAPPSEP